VNDGNGWDHVYDLSYFFGFFVSGTIHWALHTTFPAKKQRGASPFEMELHRTRPAHLQGLRPDVESTASQEYEAIVIGKEKGSQVS
jgi:NCS1 family nucleobase:cation symporter-1